MVPAGIVVTKAISLPGEVQPFGVAKLIANEGEVRLSSQPQRCQPYQLVQSHASVNDGRPWRHGGHVGVHLGVHQPEGKALVSN